MTNLQKAVYQYDKLEIGYEAKRSVLVTAAIMDLADAIRESKRLPLPSLSEDSHTKPSGRGGPSEF